MYLVSHEILTSGWVWDFCFASIPFASRKLIQTRGGGGVKNVQKTVCVVYECPLIGTPEVYSAELNRFGQFVQSNAIKMSCSCALSVEKPFLIENTYISMITSYVVAGGKVCQANQCTVGKNDPKNPLQKYFRGLTLDSPKNKGYIFKSHAIYFHNLKAAFFMSQIC